MSDGASATNSMNDRSDLTSRICQTREDGVSMHEAILTLGNSWDQWEIARRIVGKFETEGVLLARRNRFMAEIRNADDLDKKWRVSYLMQALSPRPITQTAITRYFEWSDCKEISLRQLMDLTIPERTHPKPCEHPGWLSKELTATTPAARIQTGMNSAVCPRQRED